MTTDAFVIPDLKGKVAVVTGASRGIGRAVAFLAADPCMMEKSGKILAVGDLAQEYGFTDIDGKQPPAFRIDE